MSENLNNNSIDAKDKVGGSEQVGLSAQAVATEQTGVGAQADVKEQAGFSEQSSEGKQAGLNQNTDKQTETETKDSKWLKFVRGKGVLNLPNQLTLLRMILIPVFVLMFYLPFTGNYFVALAVFAIASLTDFFDGKIARKYHLVTNLGKFLDPIADKVLVSTAFIIMLTKPYIFIANLDTWAWIVAGIGVAVILARELIISGFRMVAAGAGLVIAADKIGKYKTAAQDFSIVFLLFGYGLLNVVGSKAGEQAAFIILDIGLALFAIAVILTIISGVHYLVKNKHVLKV